MEFGKQGSSDTSSEESDQLEQVKDVKGTKRCYECTFCKRGFTNAQALGGHMNIHRKDRAKTKDQSEDQSKASRFVAPISSEPNRYYPLLEPHRDYYTSYLHPYASGSNTITNSTYWSQSMTTNPHLLCPNLSLRINSTNFEDSEVRSTEEVDLELRLGHR